MIEGGLSSVSYPLKVVCSWPSGSKSSGALLGLVDACPRPAALPLVVAQNDVVGDVSDHHAFRLRGVPYLFLSCGRWAHYHQETDTPDRLAWDKMALIRDYAVSLAGAMADGTLAMPPVDTTAMEIRYLESALGPAPATGKGGTGRGAASVATDSTTATPGAASSGTAESSPQNSSGHMCETRSRPAGNRASPGEIVEVP